MAFSKKQHRPSFRRRLVLATGGALTLALSGLALMIWLAAFAWLNHMARHTVRNEVQAVLADVVTPSGTLDVDRYNWNEPHHRFRGRHVDPFFLQIFDPQGNLIRASQNIESFPAGAYPRQPLAATTMQDDWFDPLRTFRVESQLYYYTAQPIYNEQGTRLGTVQIAREEPGVIVLYWRIALVLVAGLAGTIGLLGGLIWWVAGRVLRPLETITAATRSISPARLGQRVPIPEEADRETAQLASTLNTLLKRLERAFDEMRRFTASAAHELKTPLTALRGHVDVALRRERAPGDYQQTLELVRRKIDHLVSTTQGLLTLARLDQNGQRRTKEPVDIGAIARQEGRAFRRRAAHRGLDVQVHVPDGVHVPGQEELIREVVSNLIDNAVKYTQEGQVTISVVRRSDRVELVVEDTGMGIDPEVLPHVTDRFFRADSVDARGIQGSGLGLSLVDQIVEWHDGTFDIDSTPGAGTTVRVTFPAVSAGDGLEAEE